ncbi:MAG: PatB family C-S lyase [Chloroflexota bacterium]
MKFVGADDLRPYIFGDYMHYDFDRIIERRDTNSIKWSLYPEDVMPLWVADMDFAAPEPIIAALRTKVEHGIFGYEFAPRKLRETVAARMQKLYDWQVSPEAVVAMPGVIAGFIAAAQVACAPGQGILVQPPVYPPFLDLHQSGSFVRQDAPLKMVAEEQIIRYSVDFEVYARAINSNRGQTGMFLLCNPHNPTGTVYSRDDLSRMADICLKEGAVICSDEIHSELLLGGAQHTPIAALDPEIAARTITLVAPSKTFNVPGLFCGFAIISDKDLCKHYKKTVERMGMHISSFGLAAAQVAYSGECDEWLESLRAYLTGNRDFLVEFVHGELNGIRTTVPDATYLAWLDCNELVRSERINGSPYKYFLQQAKVALNDGKSFGAGGENFVRLNFACPRSKLVEALEKMKASLNA